MDIEYVLGRGVRLQIVEEKAQKQRALVSGAEEARLKAEKDRLRDVRMAQFRPLIDEQIRIVETGQRLTSGQPLVLDGGTLSRQITVVFGKHDVTEKTPNHTSLVNVRFCDSNIDPGDPIHGGHLEFDTVIVPTNSVHYFIDDSRYLTVAPLDNLVTLEPERTVSPLDIELAGEDVILSGLFARSSSTRCTGRTCR